MVNIWPLIVMRRRISSLWCCTCIWIHIFNACKDTFSLSSILLFQSTCIINSFFYIAVLNYFTDFRRFAMQKIMIIEDDPLIREELSLLLENEGYGVVSVL